MLSFGQSNQSIKTEHSLEKGIQVYKKKKKEKPCLSKSTVLVIRLGSMLKVYQPLNTSIIVEPRGNDSIELLCNCK